MHCDWLGTPNISREQLIGIGSAQTSELISQQEDELRAQGFTKDDNNRWVFPDGYRKPAKKSTTRVTMRKTQPQTKLPASTDKARIKPNGVRLGMAMKVSLQQKMLSEIDLADADSFRQQVWTIYQLMEIAEDYAEQRMNKERGEHQ